MLKDPEGHSGGTSIHVAHRNRGKHKGMNMLAQSFAKVRRHDNAVQCAAMLGVFSSAHRVLHAGCRQCKIDRFNKIMQDGSWMAIRANPTAT